MPQFLNLSRGIDGDYTVSTPTTYDPTTYTGSITAASKSLTTNVAYGAANGTMILIHQSQGTGAGQHEFNILVSGTGTTSLTLAIPSDYTYTNAQVYPWKQFGVVNASSTIMPAAWDGTKGGILGFSCSVLNLNTGAVFNADGKGFRGGSAVNASGRDGQQGEGYTGVGSVNFDQRPANGNGGGGGTRSSQDSRSTGGGGGGGNGAAGSSGGNIDGSGLFGAGGAVAGSSDLITMVFGGGGGRGGNASGKYGGAGGGIIYIIANTINFNGGTMTSAGNGPSNPLSGGNQDGDGGGGGGGSILLKAINATIGADQISAYGGANDSSSVGPSGHGGIGRIRVEACSLSGSINGSLGSVSLAQGGFPFCQSYLNVVF